MKNTRMMQLFLGSIALAMVIFVIYQYKQSHKTEVKIQRSSGKSKQVHTQYT